MGTYGLILRAMQIWPLSLPYDHWLHAHSHAAFLGWIHAALVLLLALALMSQLLDNRNYHRLFIFSQLTVVGMLISFPLQGYRKWSIVLLSLFLIGTYFWARLYMKGKNPGEEASVAYRFGKAGILFMILSSVSPWMLGPVMIFLGKNSIWYKLDIYFYLHFQYNGWFFLATLALIIYFFERRGIIFDRKVTVKALRFLFAGVLLGYITNTLWIKPPLVFNFLAMVSVILEGVGLWKLYKLFRPHFGALDLDSYRAKLFQLVIIGLGLKVVFQFVASCPYFSMLAYTIRDFIIGYLHFVMLGIYSLFILLAADMLDIYRLRKKAMQIYLTGFTWMEFFIFMRGWMQWQKMPGFEKATLLIFISTAVMLLGIYMFLFENENKSIH